MSVRPSQETAGPAHRGQVALLLMGFCGQSVIAREMSMWFCSDVCMHVPVYTPCVLHISCEYM